MEQTQCGICPWMSPAWPTEQEAQAHVTWHVYERHPSVWRQVFGTRPPRDRDPRIAIRNWRLP